MNKVSASFGRIGNFFNEVVVELRKCAWPTREELLESTVVVIISVAILGFCVGVFDFTVMKALELIIRPVTL